MNGGVAGSVGWRQVFAQRCQHFRVRRREPAELRSAWTGEGARPHTTTQPTLYFYFYFYFYFLNASLFTT